MGFCARKQKEPGKREKNSCRYDLCSEYLLSVQRLSF